MKPSSQFISDDEIMRRKVRVVLGMFMAGLLLSGLTAFPLERELDLVASAGHMSYNDRGSFNLWILTVRDGLRASYAKYPWIGYGTDWLAFAHVVLVVFFIGAFRDPVRNIWIIKAGLIACAMVIPLAMVCGTVRSIPLGWRMIDCSFGIIGAIPLYYCLRLAKALEKNHGSFHK